MKELLTTFLAIFIAEMGDKTQFAIMSFATKSSKPFYIWFGASLAFLVTSFLAVILGQSITKFFPQNLIKYISGSLFIIIGIWTIFSR